MVGGVLLDYMNHFLLLGKKTMIFALFVPVSEFLLLGSKCEKLSTTKVARVSVSTEAGFACSHLGNCAGLSENLITFRYVCVC
jgi:hypothetical protein